MGRRARLRMRRPTGTAKVAGTSFSIDQLYQYKSLIGTIARRL
jgi:hypothetical protein